MPDQRTHIYDNIGKSQIDAMFDALTSRGSVISGSNPWDIHTNKHGVRLRGEWNEAASTLSITVLAADWYVPRKTVWNTIDSLMRRFQDAG